MNHGELYGFVPALALGSQSTINHLEKVNSVEHLIFLSQLCERREWEFPPE
ncbi:T6SS immunity protein Tdi1 domain-containing protein [Pseudomonas synxantha]|uniref:T6SS immunity protein Tdi1 domain-containing protein n=1 Tax=Pseudomonas synxantha TaxID=47883 RepID=UPI002E80A274|nr:T6SS immunity protein Tdi1 domain-containing protein [Pseudomonas synxantha]